MTCAALAPTPLERMVLATISRAGRNDRMMFLHGIGMRIRLHCAERRQNESDIAKVAGSRTLPK
jgi:hypothetical protein